MYVKYKLLKFHNISLFRQDNEVFDFLNSPKKKIYAMCCAYGLKFHLNPGVFTTQSSK